MQLNINTEIHLLIVDDDPLITNIASRALEKKPYTVKTAGSGEEALEILKESQVDILITDLSMPWMSGLELMEKVVKLYPELLVIVLTGHGNLDSAVEAMSKGAVDYLQKPLDLIEIQLAVYKVAQKLNMNRELHKRIDLLKKENESLKAKLEGSK